MSSKERREEKLSYYGRRIVGLKAYMYFWLPVITVLLISGIVQYITAWDGNALGFVVQLVLSVTAVWAWVTIYDVSSISWVSNIIFLIVFGVGMIINIIPLFSGSAELMGTSIFGGFLGRYMMVISIVVSGFFLIFVGFYLGMFCKHKVFFRSSLKTLQKFSEDETA
ncbi:hypothetical protein [Gehongia tenuis]|uniref:Uncharacterized protein n=1 Tax=Gehongia tenuis TaxID=2763655 RepID=A0A926D5K4_9FIRM|nr:hypothetical protein [Gehongia tenuis]MBC8531778.1 hypothetical protein [Gehongia tenuis]